MEADSLNTSLFSHRSEKLFEVDVSFGEACDPVIRLLNANSSIAQTISSSASRFDKT